MLALPTILSGTDVVTPNVAIRTPLDLCGLRDQSTQPVSRLRRSFHPLEV